MFTRNMDKIHVIFISALSNNDIFKVSSTFKNIVLTNVTVSQELLQLNVIYILE